MYHFHHWNHVCHLRKQLAGSSTYGFMFTCTSVEYFLISSVVAICVQLSSEEVEDSWGVGLTILVHRLQKMGVAAECWGERWVFLERCLYLEETMKKRRQYEERTNHLSCTFHRSCKFSQFLARDAQESEDFLVHKILLVWTNFPEVTLLTSPAFTVHFAENGIKREIVPNRILEVQQGQGVKLIVAIKLQYLCSLSIHQEQWWSMETPS